MNILAGRGKAKENSLLDRNAIKVIVIGCIAIITALLIMSITSVMIMNNAVITKLKSNDLGNLAQSIGTVIEGKIDRAVDASLMMADDPVLIAWVKSGEKDETTGSLVQSKMVGQAGSLGYDTTFLVSNVTKRYWSFYNGKFGLLDTVSEDDPDDSWFFTTLAMKKSMRSISIIIRSFPILLCGSIPSWGTWSRLLL